MQMQEMRQLLQACTSGTLSLQRTQQSVRSTPTQHGRTKPIAPSPGICSVGLRGVVAAWCNDCPGDPQAQSETGLTEPPTPGAPSSNPFAAVPRIEPALVPSIQQGHLPRQVSGHAAAEHVLSSTSSAAASQHQEHQLAASTWQLVMDAPAALQQEQQTLHRPQKGAPAHASPQGQTKCHQAPAPCGADLEHPNGLPEGMHIAA